MDGRVRVVKGRLAGRAALALVACCAFVALAGCAAGETSGLGEGPGATSDGAALREGAARLPFAIEGVASDAPVVEVADAAKMLPVFNGASAPVRFEVGMLPS